MTYKSRGAYPSTHVRNAPRHRATVELVASAGRIWRSGAVQATSEHLQLRDKEEEAHVCAARRGRRSW